MPSKMEEFRARAHEKKEHFRSRAHEKKEHFRSSAHESRLRFRASAHEKKEHLRDSFRKTFKRREDVDGDELAPVQTPDNDSIASCYREGYDPKEDQESCHTPTHVNSNVYAIFNYDSAIRPGVKVDYSFMRPPPKDITPPTSAEVKDLMTSRPYDYFPNSYSQATPWKYDKNSRFYDPDGTLDTKKFTEIERDRPMFTSNVTFESIKKDVSSNGEAPTSSFSFNMGFLGFAKKLTNIGSGSCEVKTMTPIEEEEEEVVESSATPEVVESLTEPKVPQALEIETDSASVNLGPVNENMNVESGANTIVKSFKNWMSCFTGSSEVKVTDAPLEDNQMSSAVVDSSPELAEMESLIEAGSSDEEEDNDVDSIKTIFIMTENLPAADDFEPLQELDINVKKPEGNLIIKSFTDWMKSTTIGSGEDSKFNFNGDKKMSAVESVKFETIKQEPAIEEVENLLTDPLSSFVVTGTSKMFDSGGLLCETPITSCPMQAPDTSVASENIIKEIASRYNHYTGSGEIEDDDDDESVSSSDYTRLFDVLAEYEAETIETYDTAQVDQKIVDMRARLKYLDEICKQDESISMVTASSRDPWEGALDNKKEEFIGEYADPGNKFMINMIYELEKAGVDLAGHPPLPARDEPYDPSIEPYCYNLHLLDISYKIQNKLPLVSAEEEAAKLEMFEPNIDEMMEETSNKETKSEAIPIVKNFRNWMNNFIGTVDKGKDASNEDLLDLLISCDNNSTCDLSLSIAPSCMESPLAVVEESKIPKIASVEPIVSSIMVDKYLGMTSSELIKLISMTTDETELNLLVQEKHARDIIMMATYNNEL